MQSALDEFKAEHSRIIQKEAERLRNEPDEIQQLIKQVKDLQNRVENLELRLAYSDRR